MAYKILFKQCGSDHYTKGRSGRKIDGIGIHYTGTSASAKNNAVYFARNENQGASAHYFIDDISAEIYQSVKDSDTAWAVGNWDQNCRTISIEVVSNGDDFSATERAKLKWLVQNLMHKYGIPKSRVIRHYDVTGKRCPAPYVSASKWEELKKYICGGSSEIVVSNALEVDGLWGTATTLKLQQVLDAPYKDGEISRQNPKHKSRLAACTGGWEFVEPNGGEGGSQTIALVQKKIGVEVDGLMGPDTINGLIKYFMKYGSGATKCDGKLDKYSITVKAMQKRLNEGKF